MKKLVFILIVSLGISGASAQYTEVINSNRPGASYSAYSVGTNVLQFETGLGYEQRDFDLLRIEERWIEFAYVIRYGFLVENLEVIVDGSVGRRNFRDNVPNPPLEKTETNFTSNSIGFKYLIYDPWKDPEKNKVNLYSWRANNTFQWRNLIPAIAVYAGVNLNPGDNPFIPQQDAISPKALLATQHHLTPRWVLTTNWVYDLIATDDPLFNYVFTLSHSLRNGRYSIFAEHQGYHSDAYADAVFRAGAARLMDKNFQLDISAGLSVKDTPNRYFGAIGASFRLDYHKDKPKKVDNLSSEDKRALKKAKKKQKKNKKRF